MPPSYVPELPSADDPHPPYGRTGHPYFMHEMIRAQPASMERTVRSALAAAPEVPPPPADRPLLFVGQGTSFHAALGAAAAARFLLGPRTLVRAIASFDALLEPDQLEAAGGAVVFSASGETALTIQAQRALRHAKVPQTLVTGSVDTPSEELADFTLRTEGADERSWTHTVSFTTALSAAYALLSTWAGRDPRPVEDLSRAAASVVGAEPEWKALAERLADRQRFLLLGSGTAEVTVREAALKLREGAARFVAWAGVEEFLHGTLPSVSDEAALLAVAPSPLELARARTAVRAASLAGAKSELLGVLDGRPGEGEHALPEVLPAFGPAVHVIPFQLLTYWTAVAEGRNPDVMGYDRPPIWAARRSFGI